MTGSALDFQTEWILGLFWLLARLLRLVILYLP
jgi:hypothetical protein